MILFKCDLISLSRAFRRPAAVISSLGLFLLLLSGCLNAPKQETTPAGATGKVRKVSKSGGTVVDLATGLNTPGGLAMDQSGNLYFSEVYTGMIKSVPQSGGTVTVLSADLFRPYSMIVRMGLVGLPTAAVLFLVEFDANLGGVTKICLTANCFAGEPNPNAPPCLDSLVVNQAGPVSLTLDNTYVYYTNRDGKEVMRIAQDSCSPQVPFKLADANSGLTGPQDIVWTGSTLYFTDTDPFDPSNGALRCIASDGTGLTTIASGLKEPGPLGTDGTNIYFSETAPGTTNGKIWKVSAVCAPGSPTVLADGLTEPAGIAVNTTDSNLYFTERAGGRIWRVPKDGSAAKSLVAENLNQPFRLIMDNAVIYFTESATIF